MIEVTKIVIGEFVNMLIIAQDEQSHIERGVHGKEKSRF